MPHCPRCACDQFYRIPRNAFEKIAFSQSYVCRMCGFRSWTVRPGLSAVFRLVGRLRPGRSRRGSKAMLNETTLELLAIAAK